MLQDYPGKAAEHDMIEWKAKETGLPEDDYRGTDEGERRRWRKISTDGASRGVRGAVRNRNRTPPACLSL